MWIFKSFTQDFLRLYLSAILAFICLHFFLPEGENSLGILVLSFVVLNLMNVGHVYITFLKTWFDPQERKYSRHYWITPLSIIALIVSWRYIGEFKYFWVFYVYFDLFHNLRQGLGIMKWYEKLNQSFHKYTKLFYYGLTFLPFFIYNFRTTSFSFYHYYVEQEVFFNFAGVPFAYNLGPLRLIFDNNYHFYFSLIYFLFLNIWFIYELNYYLSSKKLEINRLFSMVYFGSIYAYGFIFATHALELLILLVASHGLPYIFLFYFRLQKIKLYPKHLLLFLIGLMALGGGLDYVYTDIVEGNRGLLTNPNIKELLIILLFVTPALCHFIWDGYLWKSNHPDSKKYYSK